MSTPVFSQAALIEQSLEMLGERCADPTLQVYERLFGVHPEMKDLFWRDANDAIKGEMLSRVFEAILDFIGERRYAGHMIGTEMITHEGYDVPREVFATFFSTVAATVKEIFGPDWTPELDGAWRDLLADIDGFASRVPRVA